MAAGDITDDLVDELQTRMNNPEGDKFTDSMCLSALNHAQVKTALFLHPSYLTELETKSGALNAVANVEPYDETFDPPMLNGGAGLLAVAVSDTAFVKEKLIEDMKITENTYHDGSSTNKLFYKWAGDVVFDTGSATQISYFYYHERPPTMTTIIDPLLNANLHDIMLRFAEAILSTADQNLEKRQTAYKAAMDQIKSLNEKAFKREPLGIGPSDKLRQIERGE